MDNETMGAINQAKADGQGRRKKTVNVDGVNYLLQHPGARWYLKLMDRCKNANGSVQTETYTDEVLENVVVNPKVTIETFDQNIGSLNKLVQEIESFLASAS
ncbi:MAG TPA: hypothetical protein VHY08_11690 [Bacillota bacterium]|nr:hypothetical protein [Bacillota bacterium]